MSLAFRVSRRKTKLSLLHYPLERVGLPVASSVFETLRRAKEYNPVFAQPDLMLMLRMSAPASLQHRSSSHLRDDDTV
jgi:hypothetical protein